MSPIHFDGEESACRLCGKVIRWRLGWGGRPKPFDLDGTSHFVTCRVWRERCAARDAKAKAERDARQGRLF